MKKILLSAALLAACGMASAQKLTYVPYATPGDENAFRMGESVSPNGRWIAGGDGEKGFICDMTTGEVKNFASEFISDETISKRTATINTVSNDGIGYGYMEEEAAKFDFATGTYQKLVRNLGSSVAAVNGDGTFAVGYTYDDDMTGRNAVYWDKEEMKVLPQPTESWIGFETDGYQAVAVSGDSATIVGFAVDNFSSYPLVLWHRNTDGSYSVNPVCKRYFNATFESWQKYDSFNAECISENGKWIAVNLHDVTDDWSDGGMYIGRYDVEADTLGIIECPDHSAELYYYANGIANDGTIVGTVEGNGRFGIIVNAGENTAKYLSEVYPSVTELAQMEELMDNCPTDITPDGRYILGFGAVISPLDEDQAWTATWLLDTGKETTAVENAKADNEAKKVVASYDVEGKKINKVGARRNSLVIDRLANGKAVKSIVK